MADLMLAYFLDHSPLLCNLGGRLKRRSRRGLWRRNRVGLIAAPSHAQRFESIGSSTARLLLQPVNPGQLLGVASKHPSLFADPGIDRADSLTQFILQCFMQFALRLVFFPQLRSIDPAKRWPLLVFLLFPALLVVSGHKSAEPRFQRRLRETAINRARFDVYQRPAIRDRKSVCAQIKPDTVSVRDPVKLLPTCRVNESLGMPLKPCLE